MVARAGAVVVADPATVFAAAPADADFAMVALYLPGGIPGLAIPVLEYFPHPGAVLSFTLVNLAGGCRLAAARTTSQLYRYRQWSWRSGAEPGATKAGWAFCRY
ncbi:hypothetical protein D3C81_1455430 [compost metagenome]